MILREATHEDIDSIVGIDDIARSSRERRAFIEQAVSNGNCMVVISGDHVLGYGVLARFGFGPSGVIHNLDPGDPELVYCSDTRRPKDSA